MDLEASLKGHFLSLYHMALSDTAVDTTELEVLYQIGEEKGITRSEIDQVVIKADQTGFSQPDTIIDKISSLYDFARIAWADGVVDINEKRMMELFCRKFGFEEANIPTIIEFLLDEAEKKTESAIVLKIVQENL